MRYQHLTVFLACHGVTFLDWLAMARNYDPRHRALYEEFDQLENKL
ncbi:TPA: hypothetical protein L9L30_004600 [Klebsiella quasipneumoniae subsp. quasipneumoniae]|nr:hypothetical protein [Klebsiella quasipneumoniae subsp. quasipneumoniae]